MPAALFGPPRQLTSGSAVDLRAAWDASGERLVFERLTARPDSAQAHSAQPQFAQPHGGPPGRRTLWSIGADGLGLALLPPAVNPPGTNSTGRPAFLGSGDFVFVSDRSGREALYRCRGDEVRPLLLADAPCYGPACQPGGRALLHFRPAGPGEVHLWASDPDGQGARQLTAAAGAQNQPWPLADGQRLVYHARVAGPDGPLDRVMLQPLDLSKLDPEKGLPGGGEEGAVSLSPEEGEGTAYVTPYPSPDGAWIAFTCAEAGLPQVWVMRPDGSGRQPVTVDEPHCFPAWSPDGRTLAVVRGEPMKEGGASGHLWLLPRLDGPQAG